MTFLNYNIKEAIGLEQAPEDSPLAP